MSIPDCKNGLCKGPENWVRVLRQKDFCILQSSMATWITWEGLVAESWDLLGAQVIGCPGFVRTISRREKGGSCYGPVKTPGLSVRGSGKTWISLQNNCEPVTEGQRLPRREI